MTEHFVSKQQCNQTNPIKKPQIKILSKAKSLENHEIIDVKLNFSEKPISKQKLNDFLFGS